MPIFRWVLPSFSLKWGFSLVSRTGSSRLRSALVSWWTKNPKKPYWMQEFGWMQDGRSLNRLLCWCWGRLKAEMLGGLLGTCLPWGMDGAVTAAESCLHSALFPCSQRKAGPALGNLDCHLEGLNLGFCFDSGLLFHVLLSICSPNECYPTGVLLNVKC